MLAEKEVAAPASSVANDPIFVAIEMSRSKWVVGTHIPTSSKVGIYTVEWGDAAALLALVERLRSVPPTSSASRTCRSRTTLLRGRLRRILALPPARRRRAPCLGDRPFQPAGQSTRQAREDGSDRREGDDPCADWPTTGARTRCSAPSTFLAWSRRTTVGSFGNGRAWFTTAPRIPTAFGDCR